MNLEDELAPQTVTLIAGDGTKVECNYDWCKLSKLIQVACDDGQTTEVPFNDQIANGDLLQHIVQYFTLRKGEAAPLIEDPLEFAEMSKVTVEENAKFIDDLYTNKGVYFLYDITNAANYLGMTCLLNLCCAKIASIIKNQPIKDIPTILNPEKRVKGPNGNYLPATSCSTSTTTSSTNAQIVREPSQLDEDDMSVEAEEETDDEYVSYDE
jgi:hypothetical protein